MFFQRHSKDCESHYAPWQFSCVSPVSLERISYLPYWEVRTSRAFPKCHIQMIVSRLRSLTTLFWYCNLPNSNMRLAFLLKHPSYHLMFVVIYMSVAGTPAPFFFNTVPVFPAHTFRLHAKGVFFCCFGWLQHFLCVCCIGGSSNWIDFKACAHTLFA